MYNYSVGEKVMSPSAEGVTFDITDSGAILLVKFPHPTAKEKREFKSRGWQFKVATVDEIVFLLVRMGTLAWMDAPYNVHRSKHLTTIPSVPDGEGLAVHALFIDAATGILVAQKLVSMETVDSRQLMASIVSQPHMADYDIRLSNIMEKYQTTDLLGMV